VGAAVDRGHAFVADDMVEVSFSEGNLIGRSPKLLKNFLEIRSIGILNVAAHFSPQAVLKQKQLSLVIQLEEPTAIPHAIHFTSDSWSFLGVSVPMFYLFLSQARPREVLLETLVRKYQLMQKGYDTCSDFLENHSKELSISA